MMWGVISAQWVALAVLALLVVGLMREVGLMQLKIGPPGGQEPPVKPPDGEPGGQHHAGQDHGGHTGGHEH